MSVSSLNKRDFRDGLERVSSQQKLFSDLIRIAIDPVAEILAIREEKNAVPAASMLPEAVRIEKRAKELKVVLAFEPERQRLVDTITHLFEYGPMLLSSGAWNAVHQELQSLLEAMKATGAELKNISVSEEFLLSVYTLTKLLFERGLYERASSILFFLVTICPGCCQFWVAYGLLNQRTHRLNTALNAFLEAAAIDSTSLAIQLHLADCYADMFNRQEAEEIFHQVEKSMNASERATLEPVLASVRLKLETNLKGREK